MAHLVSQVCSMQRSTAVYGSGA